MNSINTKEKQRNPSFDVLKFFLIAWVVWGHLQSTGLVQSSGSFLENFVWRAKHAVNMPAFFALSGYFALSTFQNGTWSKILARVSLFAQPRATFAIIFVVIELLICMPSFRGLGATWSLFLGIYRSRWFLRTLGALYLLSAIIFRLGRKDLLRWILFAMSYLALLFFPGRFRWCLSYVGGDQIVHMFPYFVFGLMILRKYQLWKNRVAEILCLVFFLSVILHEGLCNMIVLSTWKSPMAWPYLFLHDWGFPRLLFRTCLGMLGTISLLSIVEHLVHLFPPMARLATFGTTTLGIYIIHERPFELFVHYLPSLALLPSWTRLLLTFVWFFVCHFSICAISANSKLKTILFGNEEMFSQFYQSYLISPICWLRSRMKSIC
ncbi:MAG: acyltransferase family protein [Victivallales bacterium]|nr:acyltransferase family protein [Victivallales bacterium]